MSVMEPGALRGAQSIMVPLPPPAILPPALCQAPRPFKGPSQQFTFKRPAFPVPTSPLPTASHCSLTSILANGSWSPREPG